MPPPVSRTPGNGELEADRRYSLHPSAEGGVWDGPHVQPPQAETFILKEEGRGSQGKGGKGPSATTAREDGVRQAINSSRSSSWGGPPLWHTPLTTLIWHQRSPNHRSHAGGLRLTVAMLPWRPDSIGSTVTGGANHSEAF